MDLEKASLDDVTTDAATWERVLRKLSVRAMPPQGMPHPQETDYVGFTTWLAGAGLKKGIVYGATDQFGFAPTENKVHGHDLHAIRRVYDPSARAFRDAEAFALTLSSP